MLATLASAGCLDDRVVAVDGDHEPTGSSGSSATSATSSSTGTSTSTSSISSTTLADDTTSNPSTGSTGVGFVEPKDDMGLSLHCNLLTQNCPAGQKCTAWADDGGGTWNAARCVPIAEDPAEVGEPCHMEGSPTSGIDDCELGSMCWDVDFETLEGICVGFCVGPESDLYCENPNETCHVGADGIMPLCIPLCNPLESDCPPGDACYPIQESWHCAPDTSGDMGAYGDPCEFINLCDSGLICLGSETVPPGLPCEGAAGCCTEVCDITDPAGDSQCAGAAEGQTCQPWYEEGDAPVVLENVGVCALPA